MTWEDIIVSTKILGHISSGVYRSAGGALKELVSNAFDVNATRVVITTNWPSFDIITCYDNGTGMTFEEFRRVMKGGIGESFKRSESDTTIILGRPVIGWLGIGMLGIAQICHEFKVISHHSATKTAFQASIKLGDYLGEKVEALNSEHTSDKEFEVGQFSLEKIDYDPSQIGTYVIAADMRSAFVRKFREHPGPPLPSKFSAFLETIHRERSIKELGDYWQMVWELTVACPIPYMDDGPFQWESVEVSYGFREKLDDLKQTLKDYQFEVVVDGLSLRKPNLYPYPSAKQDGTPILGKLFPIDKEMTVYERPLKLFGYIYLQDGQAIEPMELRGLLIRIRNVAIGAYDPTFLKYPKIEGPRYNWLSSEVFVESGLEHALNIDRDSFNEIHPHFVGLQQTVHSLLEKVFFEASKGVKERSLVKQEEEQARRQKALRRLLEQELGSKYEIVITEDNQLPLIIDTKRDKILINNQSILWPRSKNNRELAQRAAFAFEISMLAPEPERRTRFYKLLSQLLDL